MTNDLRNTAERALGRMRELGFDAALVTASAQRRNELNVAHNEPSLLRSGESAKLQFVGLLDGRRAAAEISDLGDDSVAESLRGLRASVESAPQDDANAVSSDQRAHVVQGAGDNDLAALTRSIGELLSWREREAPAVMLEEALAAHNELRSHTLTSGGTELSCELRWCDATAFGVARDGAKSSSFNYAGGTCEQLTGAHFVERFGIGEMLRQLESQVHTQPLGASFVGSVVLTPRAAEDLLGWLLGQLSDQALIDASSVYRDRVGEAVAAPLLTLRNRPGAAGVGPFTPDAFAVKPLEVLTRGRLNCLTPSLYGSRKTGIAHVPVSADGWEMAAGATPLDEVIGGVARGALVDRLSMGRPGANGDFSGVIKNSFAIDGGQVGAALSETMISGNVAQMLRDVSAVSAERIDTGGSCLPWLRVEGLHFS